MGKTNPNINTSTGNISPLLIRRFASNPQDSRQIFEALKKSNPEFADWFMIRLEQLAPTPITTSAERYAMAQLALETFSLIDQQSTINHLKTLWPDRA
jgi:hypothetical protein